MPKMNKGGKLVFGKSLIRDGFLIQLPPQAIKEYNIATEERAYLFTGSFPSQTKATKQARFGGWLSKRKAKRPLGIPTMYDRAMQALYALALDPVSEVTADKHSFGFRKGRCCQDAGEYAFAYLSKRVSPEWVLEGDIN